MTRGRKINRWKKIACIDARKKEKRCDVETKREVWISEEKEKTGLKNKISIRK